MTCQEYDLSSQLTFKLGFPVRKGLTFDSCLNHVACLGFGGSQAGLPPKYCGDGPPQNNENYQGTCLEPFQFVSALGAQKLPQSTVKPVLPSSL